jgi:hypothetical protein
MIQPMKKNLLFLCLTAIITDLALTSSAQSIQVSDSSGVLQNGAEITILRNPVASSEITSELFVKNLTASSIDVNVIRTNKSEVSGTYNFFCWGACFPPSVDTGSVFVTIPKNHTDSTFSGHYTYENPSGVYNQGTTRVQYKFYNVLDMSDAVTVTINYVCGYEGLGEYAFSKILDAPYPNPANNSATFNYRLPASVYSASIIIRNLLGCEVQNVALENGNGEKVINTSGLPTGIYLYSLVIDNKVIASKKLIVKH